MELTKAESVVVADMKAGCTLLRSRRHRSHRRAAWQGGRFFCGTGDVAISVANRLLAKGVVKEVGMDEAGNTLFALADAVRA
jgi:hypothetical protein